MAEDLAYAMPVVPEGFTRDPTAPGANTTLLAVSCVFFPLAVLFTVGRIYTRAVLVRTVSFDDCKFDTDTYTCVTTDS